MAVLTRADRLGAASGRVRLADIDSSMNEEHRFALTKELTKGWPDAAMERLAERTVNSPRSSRFWRWAAGPTLLPAAPARLKWSTGWSVQHHRCSNRPHRRSSSPGSVASFTFKCTTHWLPH